MPITNDYSAGFQPTRPKDLADGVGGVGGWNTNAALTAKAGGGQTSATQLVGGSNEVSVAASSNDSVKLPRATPGTFCFLSNNGAQTVKIFTLETSGVTIDGTSGATGTTIASAKNALYVCVSATQWESILTA